uniref:Uncharacterized protein n=1 Tax=Aegilops tauschii subsp. strangulata TaxID=200361 RepID=A0A453N3W6_AEGTS
MIDDDSCNKQTWRPRSATHTHNQMILLSCASYRPDDNGDAVAATCRLLCLFHPYCEKRDHLWVRALLSSHRQNSLQISTPFFSSCSMFELVWTRRAS